MGSGHNYVPRVLQNYYWEVIKMNLTSYGKFISLISAGGVRQAVKYVIGKYSSSAPSASADTESNVENHTSTERSPAADQSAKEGVLIVDPAALNGIALIETIRILYRRVGAENFEDALDELRDVLCAIAAPAEEA